MNLAFLAVPVHSRQEEGRLDPIRLSCASRYSPGNSSLESGELTPFSKENPKLRGGRCQVIMQTVASGHCQSFVKLERLYLQTLTLCEGLSLLLWSPDGFGQEMNATGAVCLGCGLPVGADA